MDEVDAHDYSEAVDAAVARNVKRRREKSGLSQAEVARLMTEAGVPGIHQTTVARIESGQRTLRLAEALVLARLLDYQVEDLVESTASGALRDEERYLREAVRNASEAARELLYRRAAVADRLDRIYPVIAGVTAEWLQVNPGLYEILDELLGSNSDLAWITREAYEDSRAVLLRSEHLIPFEYSRTMELLAEAIAFGWRSKVNDLTEAPDDAFEAVRARFEAGEDA